MGKIKFDPDKSLIVVEAILVGKENDQEFLIKLAFDTGAAVTTISYDMVKYLGYEPGQSQETAKMITVDNIESVPMVRLREFSIGNEPIEDLEVYCYNFPKERYVDGVIGLNYIRNFSVKMDFDKGEIILDRR
ncbi:MAG: retropepsin-like domain-containing protein [Endomicrobiales bacterium]|nr:retropepsin-like domain-containing protein [Endomicrobiales bacterium]